MQITLKIIIKNTGNCFFYISITRKETSGRVICDYTECPTRYGTLHLFNNSNTNEDIVTKFEQECIRCGRNEEESVCSALYHH